MWERLDSKVRNQVRKATKSGLTVTWGGPEMLDALRRTGWHNYSLFLRDDGLLFGCFEAEESFQASLDGMAREEVNQRWQDFMASYFEGLGGAHADQNMQEWEEVFHLD